MLCYLINWNKTLYVACIDCFLQFKPISQSVFGGYPSYLYMEKQEENNNPKSTKRYNQDQT